MGPVSVQGQVRVGPTRYFPGSPGVPREPETRVQLQDKGLEDSQGSSRTPWAALVSLPGVSSPSSGIQYFGASPRTERRTVSKEMHLEGNFSQLKTEAGIHRKWALPLKSTAPVPQGRSPPRSCLHLRAPMETPQTHALTLQSETYTVLYRDP